MRQVLDPVSPEDLHPAFISIHNELQRQKVLKDYQYLDSYLLSLDATGQFASTNVSCENCCTRKLRNGKIQHYHHLLAAVIVHPDKANVLPLFPEAITRQDGTKNTSTSGMLSLPKYSAQGMIVNVMPANVYYLPYVRLFLS